MNSKTLNKLVKKAKVFHDMPEGAFKHFSFIMDGSRPLSFGWNQTRKTHPKSNKYGYRFNNIHSEFDALLNYLKNHAVEHLHRYTMVNIRLNKAMELRLSKPCSICDRLLDAFRIGNVIYSTNKGGFVEC